MMSTPADLFAPFALPNGVVLKNRIVKSAMSGPRARRHH